MVAGPLIVRILSIKRYDVRFTVAMPEEKTIVSPSAAPETAARSVSCDGSLGVSAALVTVHTAACAACAGHSSSTPIATDARNLDPQPLFRFIEPTPSH